MSAPVRLAGAGSFISRLFLRNTKGIWKGKKKATALFDSKTKANKCIPRRQSIERERETAQAASEAVLGHLMTVKKFPEEQRLFVGWFVCLFAGRKQSGRIADAFGGK